jgi:hypothetical protein
LDTLSTFSDEDEIGMKFLTEVWGAAKTLFKPQINLKSA